MSTTVIGPYEDDDPTEACSTIHHEVIGTTTCLSGGEDVSLAPLTTLKVGGPARHLVIATTHDELLATVRDCDRRGEPCLVLGGGSNVLVGDNGFDGTVVHLAWEGIERRDTVVAEVEVPAGRPGSREHGHLRQTVVIRLAAGQHWDQAVAWTVEHGLAGLEALSGIPGTVRRSPAWTSALASAARPVAWTKPTAAATNSAERTGSSIARTASAHAASYASSGASQDERSLPSRSALPCQSTSRAA